MIKEYLDELSFKYNNTSFIEDDPISIPHQFSLPYDIEISGFIAATLAWGQRKSIIKSLKQLMAWMDYSPHDFIMNSTVKELDIFKQFKYRTFNGHDCLFLLQSLQYIFQNHGSIGQVFNLAYQEHHNIKDSIAVFRKTMLTIPHLERSEKHIANPLKGSAAKRINMYLRWMVRKDNNGVDFGLWDFIPMSALKIPLDVHTGTVSRKLELLDRKQNDWKAVDILSDKLLEFDPLDPIKYDFALFGAGVNKEI